ncbi:MAG: diacylglycerol kinase family lipid kinase [Myxococcales bacterium]|nr:diacylglycerol kinase family lipid kinase [Myxococcales bacterium]
MSHVTPFKTLVILNPGSAGGNTARRWPAIDAALTRTLGRYEHAPTTKPGDATTFTRDALRAGYEMIVAIGGDGTVNEVVNGFYDGEVPTLADRLPILGIIPSGSGGDYRRTFGIPDRLDDAAARLAGHATRTVDLGRIRCSRPGEAPHGVLRYFANIASFGVSAEVSRRANESTKPLGGRLTYFVASLSATLSYERRPVTLLSNGDAVKQVSLNVGGCCIGQYFGGGMRFAPKADPGDGLFDVVTVGGRSALSMVSMTSIYIGKHIDKRGVSSWRARQVDGTCEGALPCTIEADGEVIGQFPARFELLPGAMRVKVAS